MIWEEEVGCVFRRGTCELEDVPAMAHRELCYGMREDNVPLPGRVREECAIVTHVLDLSTGTKHKRVETDAQVRVFFRGPHKHMQLGSRPVAMAPVYVAAPVYATPRTQHTLPFIGGKLPQAPGGTRLRRIRFRTCPGSDLVLFVASDATRSPTIDATGLAMDSWWVVQVKGLPDRAMRLTGGALSLQSLITRYGFLDANGCVHHRDALGEYESKAIELPEAGCLRRVPKRLCDAKGVPQFKEKSGVCWYAALCCTTFGCDPVRNIMNKYIPGNMKTLGDACLHNRDAAEELRRVLWDDYKIGDNVHDPPELDGRNGFSEFSVLCAKMKVPMLRYEEVNGKIEQMKCDAELRDRAGKTFSLVQPNLCDPHILVIRFEDGDHHNRFPILREFKHINGLEYCLVGLYLGQRRCGHQIGACSPTGDWRTWCICDADLHKDGIGPVHIYFDGACWNGGAWWAAWEEIVHVTKYGYERSEFCNLSPHNRYDDLLKDTMAAQEAGKKWKPVSKKSGQNSLDVVYVSRNAIDPRHRQS